MAQLFIDSNRRTVLLYTENERHVEYIQHQAKTVQILSVDTQKFHRDFTVCESKTSPVEFAKTLHGLAKTGVTITPAARFALEQVICKPPTTEANVPIPTKPKTEVAKKDPAKKPVAEKKSAPAVNQDDKLPKLSEVQPVDPGEAKTAVPHAETQALFDKINKKNAALGAFTKKAEEKEIEVKEEEVSMTEAEQIVAKAKAEAEKMLEEATKMVEEAKQKFAEKKALDDARAEAKKITDKAKAEVAKLKASIAKLGGKGPRKPKAEGDGEKRTRDTEDISDKKIRQLEEPTVREDSAAGAIIMAIWNSKTVAAALEYEGVVPSKIKSLVKKGLIELY